jgi:hypothetical protein
LMFRCAEFIVFTVFLIRLVLKLLLHK